MTAPVIASDKVASDVFKLVDITDTDHLLRYAAKSQIRHLKRKQVTQREVAAAIGLTPPTLSATLSGKGKSAKEIGSILHDLDAAVFAFDSDAAAKTGGLVALAARLAGYKHEGTVIEKMPSTWVTELLNKDFETPIGFLIQASALLSAFMGASSQKASDAVCSHHQSDLQKVVHPLLMLGVGAPTSHSIDALILLGGLALHRKAFEGMSDALEEALRESPMGFRVWRIITSIVHATNRPQPEDGKPGRGKRTEITTEHLQTWIRMRLARSPMLRAVSLYPARSLDLELAIAIPPDWTPTHDWVAEILVARAKDQSANLRERATATMGLWERALNHPPSAITSKRLIAERQVGLIISGLEKERQEEEARKGDGLPRRYDSAPPGGREWLIATLHHMISQGDKVSTTWPDGGHHCLTAVAAGTNQLQADPSIDETLRQATGFLFQQALLQNAGVYRRRAIDTLRGAGMAKPAAHAMSKVLDHPQAEPWLRCRILFALGFLQDRENDVEEALQKAFVHATEQLKAARRDDNLTRDLVSEVHSAIFAVGDCYGTPGQEGAARRLRGFLSDEGLWNLVDHCTEPELFRISRASAYLLTVTPQGKEDRQRLEHLAADHPDDVTRKACAWARDNRYVGNTDEVRPLHRVPRQVPR